MRSVIRGLVMLGALALVSAPMPARADGFVIPWVGTTFSQPDFGKAKNGQVTFGGAIGTLGGGGLFGFDVDFGYTPNFAGKIPGVKNSVLTTMIDFTAGPSITTSGGRGVRPYVVGGVGLIHPTFGANSENAFGWNAGGGVQALFSSRVGIRGDLRYMQTVKNSDLLSTIALRKGSFNFWRASVGIVLQ